MGRAARASTTPSADFCYTALGVFQPERLGVVQFYGAAAEADIEFTAASEALRRLAAVEATLANYPQSRTVFPELMRVELLTDRLRRLPRLLAILGHPDPRLAQKGLGRDGAIGQADDELLSQQGENLLRGLARLSEDFVFLVTAAHVARPVLDRRPGAHGAGRQPGRLAAARQHRRGLLDRHPAGRRALQRLCPEPGPVRERQPQPGRDGQRGLEPERVAVVGPQRRRRARATVSATPRAPP